MSATGLLLVDKPAGVTSHDVVMRARRTYDTRKVGHAGTLDPMATGLLALGVEGATRLLTYLVGLDKTYTGTIRLGQSTTTDDAEGEPGEPAPPEAIAAADKGRIATAMAELTGTIQQVPSAVSAIKVNGQRSYARVRAGESVELDAREITVSRFEVLTERRRAGGVELDVEVDCSSGTYIRALARDLGAALGIGGHLAALRRTRVGPFEVAEAHPAGALAERLAEGGWTRPEPPALLAPADVAGRVLGRLDVTEAEATDLRHGKRLAGAAVRLARVARPPHAPGDAPVAAVDPRGVLIGIVERRGEDLKSAMNMPEGA